MITIEDNDLPVTVAQKIITGTKENDSEIGKKLSILAGGDGTVDMFSLEEIQEIAEYLQVYINNHENGY